MLLQIRQTMRRCLLAALALLSVSVHAEIIIDVTGGGEGSIPIGVVPFRAVGQVPVDLAQVISADLGRAGLFKPLPPDDMPQHPAAPEAINFDAWRIMGVTDLLGGEVRARPDGTFVVEAFAYNVFKRMSGKRFIKQYEVTERQLRGLAHHLADQFYEAVTGYPGIFSTQIMFVQVEQRNDKKEYDLMIAEADGYNAQTIFNSSEPIMSPSWSPDATRVAFVSFTTGRPQIFVQEIYTGRRTLVAAYDGINGAPVWSPDGRSLAMSLSKDGNVEIYRYDLVTKRLQRLTNSAAIDTEADWSPDGKSLVFTSDRGGRPQVYRMSADGGRPERLTFKGTYNARPRFSSDGKKITFIHNGGQGYQIAVLTLDSQVMNILSNGPNDESPSFAPNGRMVLYAAKRGSQGVLYAVSVDGRERFPLAVRGRDIREPAWSPYVK